MTLTTQKGPPRKIFVAGRTWRNKQPHHLEKKTEGRWSDLTYLSIEDHAEQLEHEGLLGLSFLGEDVQHPLRGPAQAARHMLQHDAGQERKHIVVQRVEAVVRLPRKQEVRRLIQEVRLCALRRRIL